MTKSSLHAACRLLVGIGVVALVTHTWLVMGIVVPVTVAGSSMAPTLHGPQWIYRCGECQIEFVAELDQGLTVPLGICPHCGRTSTRAIADHHGDRLLVDRTAFAFRAPRRWEVVVFHRPGDARQLCVKRIVGLPGERVSLEGGEVFIDGRRAPKPYDIAYEVRYGDMMNVGNGWQLGPAEYFVLGDNAAISDDSRSWPAGPGLDGDLLVGRPLGVR